MPGKPDVKDAERRHRWRYIMCENQKDSRWIRCPVCDSKTRTKVYADTALFNFPLFCPRCKKETVIDVMQLKMAKSK